jgi:TPR repeat protein
MMHLEGLHPVPRKDPDTALDYYIKGAARNNAYCYFELSRIYGEGEIVPKNEKLQFTYLKRAANEGFVTAQHLLGIAYADGGRLCKRNDRLALAWFREAIRNGNIVSYLNAGDLLYEDRPGTDEERGGLTRSRMFALVNYLGAYQSGAVFLKERLELIIEELRTIEGEKLPDFLFYINNNEPPPNE